MSRGIVVGALVLALGPAVGRGSTVPRVAVGQLNARATDPDVAAALAELVAFELEETGRYRVVSHSDVEKLLKLKGQQQVLGCDTPSCASDLGHALEVDQLVAGSVTKVGRSFLVILKLLDAQRAAVVKQIRGVSPAEEEQMMELVSRLTRSLVEKPELAQAHDDAAPATGGPTADAAPSGGGAATVADKGTDSAAGGADDGAATGGLLGSGPGDAFGAGGLGLSGTGQGGGGSGEGTIGLGSIGTIGHGSGTGRGYGMGSGGLGARGGGSSGDTKPVASREDKAFAKSLKKRLAKLRKTRKPGQ